MIVAKLKRTKSASKSSQRKTNFLARCPLRHSRGGKLYIPGIGRHSRCCQLHLVRPQLKSTIIKTIITDIEDNYYASQSYGEECMLRIYELVITIENRMNYLIEKNLEY